MSLNQSLKFRTLKMGCFKMPHLQMAVFPMVATVAFGPSHSGPSKITKIQFSMSKINWIFLKMIFLFQYVNSRISFVMELFHLLQNWKTLFSKNMPKIVWLRRSSKLVILQNYLITMFSIVIIYNILAGQWKIWKLWTHYRTCI